MKPSVDLVIELKNAKRLAKKQLWILYFKLGLLLVIPLLVIILILDIIRTYVSVRFGFEQGRELFYILGLSGTLFTFVLIWFINKIESRFKLTVSVNHLKDTVEYLKYAIGYMKRNKGKELDALTTKEMKTMRDVLNAIKK